MNDGKEAEEKEIEIEKIEEESCPDCGYPKKESISGNSREGVGIVIECNC